MSPRPSTAVPSTPAAAPPAAPAAIPALLAAAGAGAPLTAAVQTPGAHPGATPGAPPTAHPGTGGRGALAPRAAPAPAERGGLAPLPSDSLAAGFLARYAGTTLATYQRYLRRFAAWLGVEVAALPALLLRRGPSVRVAVDGYLAHLRDAGLRASARNGHLAAIQALVRYLRETGLLDWTLPIRGERVERYRDTRGPSVAEVRALLAAAAGQGDAATAARDVALVRVCFDLGLRRAELGRLTLADVERGRDGAPRSVAVIGKGREAPRRLTLPPRTAAAVAAWLRCRGDAAGALWTALDPGVRSPGRPGRGGRPRDAAAPLSAQALAKRLAALGRRAGIGPVRPHGLRHAAITAVLDAGVDLRRAQRFSRHADPRTLLRYDDNRQDLAGEVATVASELV